MRHFWGLLDWVGHLIRPNKGIGYFCDKYDQHCL